MSTGQVSAKSTKRTCIKGTVAALIACVVAAACFVAVDTNEAISDAGLVLNYFLSMFAPAGTTATETNPDN
ncbi:hypothetical protein AWB78_06972 [Caballeronia calidae]|uniref:Lipoprotein n=1 Tax=Caballeronia calidae TaxID=1777139 RepID=A0A158EC15_9BURK|nr:hypothetical protein [Caballeronia calidae]SAL04451.1 hypothetical protein AWB78_06972 [Caballeronia calidae]